MELTVIIKHTIDNKTTDYEIKQKVKNNDQVNGFLKGVTATLDKIGIECQVLHTITK